MSLPLKQIMQHLRSVAPNVKGLTKARNAAFTVKTIVDDFAVDGEAYHIVQGTLYEKPRRAIVRLSDDSIYTF